MTDRRPRSIGGRRERLYMVGRWMKLEGAEAWCTEASKAMAQYAGWRVLPSKRRRAKGDESA